MMESRIKVSISETKQDIKRPHCHSMIFGKSLILSQEAINKMETYMKEVISEDLGNTVENLNIFLY